MRDRKQVSDVLATQLELTRATWRRLVAHGAQNSAELRLDFFFEAPSYRRADELKRFLEHETDYEVRATAHEDHWAVVGTTQTTSVTLAMLEQWVDWMVTAGLQFECTFDGWGTEIA